MSSMKELLAFIVVFLVPLVPTVVLYRLLKKETQRIQVSVIRGGIRATGPLAAYLLLAVLANQIYQAIAKPDSDAAEERRRDEHVLAQVRHGRAENRLSTVESVQAVAESTLHARLNSRRSGRLNLSC